MTSGKLKPLHPWTLAQGHCQALKSILRMTSGKLKLSHPWTLAQGHSQALKRILRMTSGKLKLSHPCTSHLVKLSIPDILGIFSATKYLSGRIPKQVDPMVLCEYFGYTSNG